MALLVSGSGQAASKADVSVTVTRGTAPGMLDWQLADASFPGLTSVRFQLQGQTIPSITCPTGWTSQVSPTSGAACSGGSLGPGQTMAGSLTFGGSQPPTAGVLTVGNASGTEQVPFTISGSGGVQPCICLGLTASIDPRSIGVKYGEFGGHPYASIRFTVHWKLTCSIGTGKCFATLHMSPSAEDVVWQAVSPGSIALSCEGPCGGTEPGSRKEVIHASFSNFASPRHELAGKRVEIHIVRECGEKRLAAEKFSIAFDSHGQPIRKRNKHH